MKFTLSDIKKLQERGKIRGHSPLPVKTSSGRVDTRSRAKDFITLNLQYWCNEKSVTLVEEHRFDKERRFKFDFAIPAMMIAVEFEGGIFIQNSSHNSAKMLTKDTDKYNLAQSLGWKVLRFTALNYRNLLTELNKNFK